MNFTPRQDGTTRATIQIAFHIQPADLVAAAMHVVAFTDGVDASTLTKAAIERELRSNLWSSGDNFSEFGHEQVTWEATSQRDAIEAKVAELYGVEV